MYIAYREADPRVPKSAPFYFRSDHFAPETDVEPHTHPWGQIALTRGYGAPSAFIARFCKQLGFSPERYRRQICGG